MFHGWRRLGALVSLALALGMLVAGQTWWHPHLQGLGYIAYWLTCAACCLAALVLAWLDLRATRHQLSREQRVLLEQALQNLGPRSIPPNNSPPPRPDKLQPPNRPQSN
jgi:hypothetical protein